MNVKESTMTAASTAPVVSVQRASCTLGGRKVLDDVSLDVMRGQVVVSSDRPGRARPRCCGR